MRIAYTVTADVEASLHEEYVRYMRATHIPDVLATGCFPGAEFEQASATRFHTRYFLDGQATLDRYVREFAGPLRADFLRHFPSGVTLGRENWALVERWPK